MEGLELIFLQAEQTYKVNALFLIGLVATESGWGNSSRAKRTNNLTGYRVYNSQSRGSLFSSRGESILSTACLLDREYLNPQGIYFRGYSVYNINTNYCFKLNMKEPNFRWSNHVIKIAEDKQELIRSTWIRRDK